LLLLLSLLSCFVAIKDNEDADEVQQVDEELEEEEPDEEPDKEELDKEELDEEELDEAELDEEELDEAEEPDDDVDKDELDDDDESNELSSERLPAVLPSITTFAKCWQNLVGYAEVSPAVKLPDNSHTLIWSSWQKPPFSHVQYSC